MTYPWALVKDLEIKCKFRTAAQAQNALRIAQASEPDHRYDLVNLRPCGTIPGRMAGRSRAQK